jgi:uncharacterized protein (DUF983 family)
MGIEQEDASRPAHITGLMGTFVAGLTGKCPRCGNGKLFSGFLSLESHCSKCGLDFGFADSGDGPAWFVSFIGSLIVLGAAFWAELRFEPPYWVYLVVFLPLTLIVCLGLLRPAKGLLIALQYYNKAEEGRLSD